MSVLVTEVMGFNLSHNVEANAVLLIHQNQHKSYPRYLIFLCRKHTDSHPHHGQQKLHQGVRIRPRISQKCHWQP